MKRKVIPEVIINALDECDNQCLFNLNIDNAKEEVKEIINNKLNRDLLIEIVEEAFNPNINEDAGTVLISLLDRAIIQEYYNKEYLTAYQVEIITYFMSNFLENNFSNMLNTFKDKYLYSKVTEETLEEMNLYFMNEINLYNNSNRVLLKDKFINEFKEMI